MGADCIVCDYNNAIGNLKSHVIITRKDFWPADRLVA